MTSLLIDAMESNPLRSPDWRWQVAGHMVTNPATYRLNTDPLVAKARTIYAAIELCTDETDLYCIARDYPLEYRVWEVYKDPRYDMFRAEIEARLMANEHVRSIGQKAKRSPEFVQLYSQLYFDVADRLASPSAVQYAVFGNQMRQGFRASDVNSLWKLIGYWGGATVLDHFIWPLASPESTQAAATWYDATYRALAGKKAFLSMLTVRVNAATEVPIMEAFTRVRELEKAEDRGSVLQVQAVDNMSVFYNNIPWTKAHTYQQMIGDNRVAALDQRSVGMRACELADVAVSPLYGDSLAKIMESAERVPFGDN